MKKFLAMLLSFAMVISMPGITGNEYVAKAADDVSIVFTSGNAVKSNMDYVSNVNDETNGTVIGSKNGVNCLSALQGKYVYFKTLNNTISITDNDLYLNITYLDDSAGAIYIQYNSQNDGYYKSALLYTTGSGQWKSESVHITDAAFDKKQNQGADFRLGSNNETGFSISSIEVSKASDAGSTQDIVTFGRTYEENGQLKLGWTNSGCTFKFSGTGASARLTSTNTNEALRGFVNVYVDGALVPTQTIELTNTDATYTLASGLSNGEHTITLKKRNEAGYGGNATIGVSNVTVTGGSIIPMSSPYQRKIEVIGDSITSGFTNLVTDGEGNYSSQTTEGTMTYAALLGRAFGTETNVISRSGIRFVRTNTGESMIDYYEKVSGLTGNNNNWDFGDGSDVVIINLGTNDNGAKMNASDANTVSDDYVKSEAKVLLSMVRSHNPGAVIIWAYGIMGNGRSSAIQAAINELGDSNMFYYALNQLNPTLEGVACGSHPTVFTGINRSMDLAEFVAQKTGWNYNYNSQLATLNWMLRDAENDDYSEYTDESVNAFLTTLSEAKNFPANATAAQQRDVISRVLSAGANLEKKNYNLDRTGWVVSASNYNGSANYAIDGDISTRWASGPRRVGMWYMVDMGKMQNFDKVDLFLGSSTNDWPREYEIYVSDDGENFRGPVASGNTKTEEYDVGDQYARYIKIVQNGYDEGNYWSIHELQVENTKGVPQEEDDDEDVVIATFYDYGERHVNNNSGLGLYCDWTTIDGGLPLDMTANGINEGATLRITATLNAVRNGQHVSDFALNDIYLKLRSVDNNGENNAGWNNVTLREGVNQIDIPLYSDQSRYASTAYPNTSRTGNMDWSKLNRLIFVSLGARNYYGTDTEVSLVLDKVCITTPKNKRSDAAFENVRITTSALGSDDAVVYSYDAVADFGADPTGNADSTAAIQSALDQAKLNGAIVYVPSGTYRVDGTLRIENGVTLRGDWADPDNGGSGQGTILKAYSGHGNENGTPFIHVSGGSTLRDISVWYPNQSADNPVPYPYTLNATGHSTVYNVTLYNSYNGFRNNTCSSMLIRGMYGTVLSKGIVGAYAYDVPRIEKVYFDTKYWAEAGFPNSPSGGSLTNLNNYCENNLKGVIGGEQDWGYWYDINVNHAKYGCYMTATRNNDGNKVHPGNIAIGDLTTRNVDYGVYIHSISYPGLQVSYSDIEADVAGIFYQDKPANTEYMGNEDGSVNAAYYNDASVIVTSTKFSGNGYCYKGENSTGTYCGVNFNNCEFNWGSTKNAIEMIKGTLVCSNSEFKSSGKSFVFGNDVPQFVISGNTFADSNYLTYNEETTHADITTDKIVPDTPAYSYGFAPDTKPQRNVVYNAQRYGAMPGVIDSTDAIQDALDEAGRDGGGVVYVPGGYYTIRGSLSVPSGVELRGSYDGAHYGNGAPRGTVLYVYNHKDEPNEEAFITLAEGAGVRGFTMVYPEMGITDDPTLDEVVHAYPPTVRLNRNAWIRTCSINGCYDMVDAMTNVCDGFIINDLTGCYMNSGLKLGHGTNGGYVQDFHTNYTSWATNYYKHAFKEDKVEKTVYTTSHTNWMQLGDFSNVKFFSDFTILISNGLELIKDPYTGKCTKDMTTWGMAFDATGDGIVGYSGADSEITLLSSMGVYNQHHPGYNILTHSGFNGKIRKFNADVWSPQSNLVNVSGGEVTLVQYLSWCCYNGIVHNGGTANMYGSTIIGNDSASNNVLTFESGASGNVKGNINNHSKFDSLIKVGATNVDIEHNGLTASKDSDIAVEFNTYAPGTYNSSNGVITTGWKALTPIRLSNGNLQNHASIGGYNKDDLFMKVVLSLDKGSNSAADTDIFTGGNISLRQAWSKSDGTDDALCFTLGDGYFYAKTGDEYTLYMPMRDAMTNNASFNWNGVKFINITLDTGNYQGVSMTLKEAEIVDASVAEYWKYELYKAMQNGYDMSRYVEAAHSDYVDVFDRAEAMYNRNDATVDEIKDMIDEVNDAIDSFYTNVYLDRTGWSADASHNTRDIGNAFDSNMGSRWATLAVQEPGMWFTVDLGEKTNFDTLAMLLGTSKSDYPQSYEIYVSNDGVNFGSPVASGSGAKEEIYLGDQYARYVKVVNTGNKYLYWSIHEFNLANTSGAQAPVEPEVTYNVSVDGTLVATVNEGETYTLPETANVGYYESGKLYKKGSTVTVNRNMIFESVSLSSDYVLSYQMNANSGIQYKIMVDGPLSEDIKAAGAVLVTASVYRLFKNVTKSLAPARASDVTANGIASDGSFRVALAGLTDESAYIEGRRARAYLDVTFTGNGETTPTTIYGTISDENSLRAMATVTRNSPSFRYMSNANKEAIRIISGID